MHCLFRTTPDCIMARPPHGLSSPSLSPLDDFRPQDTNQLSHISATCLPSRGCMSPPHLRSSLLSIRAPLPQSSFRPRLLSLLLSTPPSPPPPPLPRSPYLSMSTVRQLFTTTLSPQPQTAMAVAKVKVESLIDDNEVSTYIHQLLSNNVSACAHCWERHTTTLTCFR